MYGENDVYTLGHSNHTIERFLEILQEFKVSRLIDVRTRPYSKYSPHFNREPLAKFLHDNQIEYYYGGTFLGGLGKVSINDPMFVTKLDRAILLDNERPSALMCSEKNPLECHRAMKLGAWIVRHRPSVKVEHIIAEKNAPLTLLSQENLEKQASSTWGWFELFSSGSYGLPKEKK